MSSGSNFHAKVTFSTNIVMPLSSSNRWEIKVVIQIQESSFRVCVYHFTTLKHVYTDKLIENTN